MKQLCLGIVYMSQVANFEVFYFVIGYLIDVIFVSISLLLGVVYGNINIFYALLKLGAIVLCY